MSDDPQTRDSAEEEMDAKVAPRPPAGHSPAFALEPQIEGQDTEAAQPDGVWILASYTKTDEGQMQVGTRTVTTGTTRPTEILSVLKMALAEHKQNTGLD